MSFVSQQYDVEGKGFLSKDQQMLRNLDTDGDGRLDASELEPFVKAHNNLRKDNDKLRRNQKFLGATTVVFGIITIIATVVAIRASKDTVVSPDGLLASKDSGLPVITRSRGVSIVSELHDDESEAEGAKNECAHIEDVAALYKAFGEGSDVRILTNDTIISGLDHGSITFPITKVEGSTAAINETHVMIGDVTFDIAADNPCNRGGRKYAQGPRKLFHDHLHGRKLQSPISSGADTVYDAVIIGAGWSGVSAAAKLMAKGTNNILLLEGRDYIGGRSQTVTGFATEEPDTPFELGCEFIYTDWNNGILDAFKEEDLAFQKVDWSYADFAPQIMGFPDGDSSPSSKMDDAESNELSSKLWSNGFLKYIQKVNLKSDSGYQTLAANFEDEEDISDPFQKQFFEAAVNANIVIEFAEDGERVSAKDTSSWLEEVQTAGMALASVPGGGYARAIDGIVKDNNVDEKVMFGADVQRVRYDEDLVHIDYIKDGNDALSVRAKTVLVTAPLGVLQSDTIKFEPELPFYKQQAISDMEVGVLDKLVMYWDDDAMAQAPNFADKWDEVADREWFELVTPETETSSVWTTFLNSRRYNGLHTMTAWIGGSAAETMEGMDDTDIVEQVVSNLKMMFASDVVSPTKFMITRWGQDEYAKGSYSFRSVGRDFDGIAEKLSRSVDNKVFFAGEHTSTSGWAGTAVGAYETGEAAGNAMAKSISGNVLVKVLKKN